jgi:ABC-2 type transport system permease protein
MNTGTSAVATTHTPMNQLIWLVRREYWENRGGFLRAPMIIAASVIGLFVLGLILGDVTAHRHGLNVSGMNISQVVAKMDADNIAKFAAGLDVGLLAMCVPIMIGMTFVVFFYLLGALYDDRKDRSVLFFKSLPISDLNTVLSKVIAGVVLAPVIAVAACIALQIAFLILVTLYAAVHGTNALPLWSPAHLLALWFKFLLLIPINALWALPTVGWLLLCSSFARSKPFLLAVVIPILFGVFLAYIGLLQQLSLPSGWYWKNVCLRVLGSLWPGSWLFSGLANNALVVPGSTDGVDLGMGKFDFVNALISMDHLLGVLTSPDLWIGAAAGAGMIAGAIWFRRNRIESYA